MSKSKTKKVKLKTTTPIKEQMAQAAREAGKENAARTAPAKKKEARDDR